jgi:hypothetical protein
MEFTGGAVPGDVLVVSEWDGINALSLIEKPHFLRVNADCQGGLAAPRR